MASKATMNIVWRKHETQFPLMERAFLAAGKAALTWNHYDFIKQTEGVPGLAHLGVQDWKEFLTDPRVADYIKEEFQAVQDTELRKLILDINDSNSVGKAQLIAAVSKQILGQESPNDGTTFIYTYVPLNVKQQQAPNTYAASHDLFLKENKHG